MLFINGISFLYLENLLSVLLCEVPKEFAKLNKLRYLDLQVNKLNRLPLEMQELKNNLKELDVSLNNISQDDILSLKNALPTTFIQNRQR